MDARARRGRALALIGLVLLATAVPAVGVGLATVTAAPVAAQCAPRIAVSKTVGLAPGGETVSVSGSCFDVNKGVYVAFCVVPPAGSPPSPCGGGVDMTGAGGLSHWISSNPPPHGVGVAAPYGPGGSFSVTMRPSAALNAQVDCRRVACAVVTRNDHTRTGDRSQDVIVPVSFAADPVAPPTTAAPVFVPPPTTAPPPPVPETTTTVAPIEETSTTTAPEDAAVADATAGGSDGGEVADGDETEELAATTASSSGSAGSGGAVLVVVLVVAVLAVGAGGGWFAVRRRSGPAGTGTSTTDAPAGGEEPTP